MCASCHRKDCPRAPLRTPETSEGPDEVEGRDHFEGRGGET